jgi:hypothetical protein
MRGPALALVLFVLPGAAAAQAPTTTDGRFQLERRGDLIVRLDRETGAISTCEEQNGELDCRASADERAALQSEIDRLAAEVDRLQAGRGEGSAERKDNSITLSLPSEEQVQGFADRLSSALSRGVDAVRDFINRNF